MFSSRSRVFNIRTGRSNPSIRINPFNVLIDPNCGLTECFFVQRCSTSPTRASHLAIHPNKPNLTKLQTIKFYSGNISKPLSNGNFNRNCRLKIGKDEKNNGNVIEL